jgi:hypothetical protein
MACPVLPVIFSGSMSDKKLLDSNELAQWLTDELRKQPGCRKCTVHSVYRPPNQDASEKTFREAFDTVVKMAKERFNLI